ncbi:MAG: hypothetical protein V3U52_01260 [Thermoplasmata archaeon]
MIEYFRLARIEPNRHEDLAVHLIPVEGSHGLCGVNVWDADRVEPVYDTHYTLTNYLAALYRGNVEAPTCERCRRFLANIVRELRGEAGMA